MMQHTITYNASAPGSIMLFGEHAVLYGGQAIVAAINQRVHIHLQPRNDQHIELQSDRLGAYHTSLAELNVQAPFEFILTAIKYYQSQLPSGFTLTIHSEFAENLGLGSSAAVTVATLRVLQQWLQQKLCKHELLQIAKQIIHSVQGAGSGADAAASIFDGVIAYRSAPVDVQPLPSIPAITLIYMGYKTPTKTVIAHVAQQQIQQPQLYAHLYSSMDSCAQHAVLACTQQKWQQFGQLMNIYQHLLAALGVSTPAIDTLLTELRQQPTILGAKISGSGLGDCVWALGQLPPGTIPWNQQQCDAGVRQIDVSLSSPTDALLDA